MNALLLITIAFSVAAVIAVFNHSRWIRELYRDRSAVREDRNTPPADRLRYIGQIGSDIRVEYAWMGINVVVALVGIGALSNLHPVGWLLILIPFISNLASWLRLRSRHK